MEIKTKHNVGDVIYGMEKGKAVRMEVASIIVNVGDAGNSVNYWDEGYTRVLLESETYDSLEEMKVHIFGELEIDA